MSASRLSLPVATVLCFLALSAAPAQPTVAWSAEQPIAFSLDRSDVTVGAKVTGVVSVVAESEERVVRIERAMPEGWVHVGSAVLPAGATEVLVPVPTGYYSSYSYRVSTTSEQALVTSSEQTLDVGPAFVPAGPPGDWAAWAVEQRWDPCVGHIRYVVNAGQAWPRALAETREALRRITRATGLRFLAVGSTRVVPKGRQIQRLPNGADLVIAWLRRGQTPLLSGGYLGRTSSFYDGEGRTTHAQVAIRRNADRYLKPGFGAAPRRGSLLMHELTHVVGLDHARSSSQIMYPDVSAVASQFGSGDLRGLAHVGAQRGCVFTAA